MGANIPQIGSLLLVILCALVSNVNSYSKYGRGCSDIGCLPSEICVMAQDTCNYGQRDGKECGTYPTCSKTGSTSNTGQRNNAGSSLNPAPDNTRMNNHHNNHNPSSNNVVNSYNPPMNPTPINPHYVFGAPQNQPPIYPNLPIFPNYQPTSAPSFQQFPQANHPAYPAFPGQIAPREPSNPYNPSYIVFGNQPNYYNPQATTRAPGIIHQFLYNKQDRAQRNSASALFGQIHNSKHHYIIILASILTILISSFKFYRISTLCS